MSFTVGIIGGGIAGSTIALKLAENGIKSVLIQAGQSLVNGPPFCHLHAGGALYRQIPTSQCIKMLKQSIETLKCYPFAVNMRPTLLTVPQRDPGTPDQIIQRMKILTQQYKNLVQQDSSNEVLGKPQQYFRVFTRQEVEELKSKDIPLQPKTPEQWMITPAKFIDLEKLKFPLVMVQQYGLSALRTSSFLNLCLTKSKNCQVLFNKKVFKLEKQTNNKWVITMQDTKNSLTCTRKVNFLINACGYKSGLIDDMAGFKKSRMVEFKAAYLTQWKNCQGKWPEIIFHGKRKTKNGMGQLTPYSGNLFQIHGMTQQITLFQNGTSNSTDNSSNPQLNTKLSSILQNGWKQEDVYQRTSKAVGHISEFIPSFSSAIDPRKPLYGAQQIPGNNPDLRSAEISYEQNQNYGRAEIVKASTAISVAQDLIKKLTDQFPVPTIRAFQLNEYETIEKYRSQHEQIVCKAKQLAQKRSYPKELAQFYH